MNNISYVLQNKIQFNSIQTMWPTWVLTSGETEVRGMWVLSPGETPGVRKVGVSPGETGGARKTGVPRTKVITIYMYWTIIV